MQNYYEILGISKDADLQTIKKAYRQIATKYHPDRNNDVVTQEYFKKAAEAFSVLSDPEKRKVYDTGHADITSVYSLFFHNVIGKKVMESMIPSAKSQPVTGSDLFVTVDIAHQKLIEGGLVTICKPDGETVEIMLPPGNQHWYKLPLFGAKGKLHAPNGDLYVFLKTIKTS